MKVIANNIPRTIISGYELSEAQREDFNYLTDEGVDQGRYFMYKGNVYTLSDFMLLSVGREDLKEWDAYMGDSYFSGLVLKLSDCGELVTVGRFSC